MLCPGNACLQVIHVRCDFRSHRAPVSNGFVASGLDVLAYLLRSLRCSSTGLLFACLDFSMRLFRGCGHCVFGLLGANGQIGQLLGEWLNPLTLTELTRGKCSREDPAHAV